MSQQSIPLDQDDVIDLVLNGSQIPGINRLAKISELETNIRSRLDTRCDSQYEREMDN